MKKNVVVIAGGNGSAKSLRGLKGHLDDISLSAVIPMFDSGGSNGRMRREKGFLPAADLMRAALSLCPLFYKELRTIFYKNRLKGISEEVDGYYIGIMWYWMMQEQGYTFMQAHEAFEQVVGAMGKTYPVTLDSADFAVSLSDGTELVGEGNIDEPEGSRDRRITKAWLTPAPTIYDDAAHVTKEADVIVLGPGSLYTSIIATLCVEGLYDAIAHSSARLVYVLGDAFQKHGEYGPKKASEFIQELEQYLPRKLDTIIMSDVDALTDGQKDEYKNRQWELIDDDVKDDPRVERTNLQRPTSFGISGPKLGAMLHDIIMR